MQKDSLNKMKHISGIPKTKLKQLIKECIKEMLLGDVIQDVATSPTDQLSPAIAPLQETSPFLDAKTPPPDVLTKVAEELVLPEQKPHRYPEDWCFFPDHAGSLDSEID